MFQLTPSKVYKSTGFWSGYSQFLGLSISKILRVSTNLHRIATICLNDQTQIILNLQINRYLERLISVFGFFNYQDFKGIYKSTQNNNYMFESHSFDHLQSTNQQAFAAARLTFWFFRYQDFKGIYKSTENNDYMFE